MKKILLLPFLIVWMILPIQAQVNFEYSAADLVGGWRSTQSFGFVVGEDDQHYLMLRRSKEHDRSMALFSKSDLSFSHLVPLPLEYTDFKPVYEPFYYSWSVMPNASTVLMPYRDISPSGRVSNLKGMAFLRSGVAKSYGTLGSKPFKGINKGMYNNFFSSDSTKVISVFVAAYDPKGEMDGKINIQVFSSDYTELCNLALDISVYDDHIDLIDADDEYIYILTGARTLGVDNFRYDGEFGTLADQFLLKISMKDGSIKSQSVTDLSLLGTQQLIVRNNEINILGVFRNAKHADIGIFIKKFNRQDLTPILDKNVYFDRAFIEDLLSEKELAEQRSLFEKNPNDFVPGIPDLELCKVHFDEKNNMYLILEGKSNSLEGFSSDQYYVYRRNHNVIGKWDPLGNELWIHSIRKKAESMAEFANTGGAAFVIKNEKIHLLYYDLGENIAANDKNKNQVVCNACLDLALVYRVIDFEGKSETKIIHYKRDLEKPRPNYILSNFYVTPKNELIVAVSDDGLWVNRMGRITFPD